MKFRTLFSALAVVAVAAMPLMANIQVTRLDLTTTGWTYQSGSGGEFQAKIVSMPLVGLPVGKTWETFCLERNENVAVPAGTYYGVLNTAAVEGGSGGAVAGGNPLFGWANQSNMGDPLDARTAYLFTQFANGTLAGYDYSANVTSHKASAAALQAAIWAIEQEAATSNAQALTWIGAANTAVANGSWKGLGNVRVLNLYSGYDATKGNVTGLRQDILVIVPAPAAAFLALLGLGFVGWLKRRLA